jgi:hypothetical protein
MKDLVFYLNGDINKIKEVIKNIDFDLVKIDEKQLIDFKLILSEISKTQYDNIYFYVINIDYQRFQFFCKLYIFCSNTKSGGIIDQNLKSIKYKTSNFMFKDIPFFLVELLASITVVLLSYPLYFFSKWILIKK